MNAQLDLNNNVVLTWAAPPGVSRMVIVRKTRDYPRTIKDGVTALDTSDPGVDVFTDFSPWPGKYNYYRIFFQDGIGAWIEAADAQARIRVEKLYDYQHKLYGNLPELYSRHDEKTELLRFLGVTARGLETLRARQSGLFDLHNVHQTRDDLLEALAWNVGWILNRELPIIRQRAEINRAVTLYRKKGTRKGLYDLLQAIMPWEVEIITFTRNILFTNVNESTTLKISDPNVTRNMGTEADTADYIMGGKIRPDKIIIRVWPDYDLELMNRVWNKLNRTLSLWIPAGMEAEVIMGTRNNEGAMVSDSRPPNPDSLRRNWFLTNKYLADDPNPNCFETLGPHLTNSLLWRTPCLSLQ